MADRLAEKGAVQYATENVAAPTTRLGAAGAIQGAIYDAQGQGAPLSRLTAKGRLLGQAYEATQPLRAASHYNPLPTSTTTYSTTVLNAADQYQYFIGSGNLKSICLAIPNFRLTTTGPKADQTNAWTIDKMVLVAANAHATAYVPVTFSGSRSRVIATSDFLVLSDAIPATAFGLTEFTQGDLFYVKVLRHVDTAGHQVFTNRTYNEADNLTMNGTVKFRSWIYDPAATTVTDPDSATPWPSTLPVTGTAAGTPSTQRGMAPLMLGRHSASAKVYFGLGDSIMDNPYSYFRAALIGSSNGVQASMEASISGGHQSDVTWIDSTLYQYANILFDEMGTNNTSDKTTSFNVTWPKARTGGIRKIVKTKLTPSTTCASRATTSVDYTGSGGTTTVVVTTAATLPSVGDYVAVAGATPSSLNGKNKLVTAVGAGTFTYVHTSNIGSGTATGTIIWSTQWTNEADQTYSDGGSGGNQGLFNAQMDTYLGAGTIDVLLELNGVRGVDYYKWKATPAAIPYPSDTWVSSSTVARHFSGVTAVPIIALTAEIAPILDAITL